MTLTLQNKPMQTLKKGYAIEWNLLIVINSSYFVFNSDNSRNFQKRKIGIFSLEISRTPSVPLQTPQTVAEISSKLVVPL